MPNVEVYFTETCPYCVRAKGLLKNKGVSFEGINLTVNPERKDEMIQRSGRKTVPQIFIDDVSMGGCDDIFALDAQGKLDTLLGID